MTDTTRSTIDLGGQARTWAERIMAAAEDAPPPVRKNLQLDFERIDEAIAAFAQAPAQMAEIITDPKFTRDYKLTRARAIIETATKAANDAIDELERDGQSAKRSLAKAILPQMPKGASDAMIVFRAGQLERALAAPAKSGPQQLIAAAAELLEEACQQGDELNAYCLSGDPLALFFRTSLTSGEQQQWRQKIAEITGKLADASGDAKPGAKLLHMLEQGGPGTLAGFLVTMRYHVRKLSEGALAHLQQLDNLQQIKDRT